MFLNYFFSCCRRKRDKLRIHDVMELEEASDTKSSEGSQVRKNPALLTGLRALCDDSISIFKPTRLSVCCGFTRFAPIVQTVLVPLKERLGWKQADSIYDYREAMKLSDGGTVHIDYLGFNPKK